MANSQVTVNTAKSLGLLPEEFEMIKEYLGRIPNFTELSIYSVMWSEHAAYKNSIKWLKKLPKTGNAVLAEAGSENAGLVDIGDDLACAFKIESHNHPCAVEPYQGAATGVGGINRDIFTMGARPIAQLNSLRFGDINEDKTKWHVKGVVKGIGDYGNAFGVPVVGGEIQFDSCYATNPLVNAMSVGIMKKGNMVSAKSEGEGNPIYIVGSATGKDGIHGATFASADITDKSSEDIPSIQVGDPFQEKLLLEASLEVAESDAIVGMQDMGAAGIICSTSEMSESGNSGMKIYLDKVPLRQKNMTPWEILLSESQERMLICVKKGREKEVEEIFEKWDLNCAVIGEVINEDKLYFYWNEELVAEVPAASLVLGGGAPQYDREAKEPTYYKEYLNFSIDNIPQPQNLRAIGDFLLQHPNNSSKKWVTQQYDSMVGTRNMTTNRTADAGIVNIKETNRALALTVDCNGRYVKADPEIGTQIAVSEAARNIVCSGGTPLAITNCLNFGNPYNKEVYWQFIGAIKGMSKACLKFDTPVTGGNVSFYNQSTKNEVLVPVNPTPVIGMVGLIENKDNIMTADFKRKGDMIYLLGRSKNDIAQSEYLVSYHKVEASPAPDFNLDFEFRLQQALSKLISQKLINSAHDVSNGGLYVTLVESSLPNSLGFDITTDAEIRKDAFLFGESQSRVVVTCSEEQEDKFIDLLSSNNIPFSTLGHVTKGSLRIDDHPYGDIQDAEKLYCETLDNYLEK